MVEIFEINKKLGNGCTVPYIVWCSDGKKYVVKFPGNPNGDRALINEFIASRLCEYLDLPIMDYALISVKKDNYNDSMDPEINQIEGTAFGTIYDEYLLTVLNSGEIKNASNHTDAIKILIFDILIGNYDRNKGNLMINSKTKKVIMIDHTHIFNIGVIWDSYQLNRLGKEKYSLENLNKFNYNNLFSSIIYDEEFYSELNNFVKKVKNIDRNYLIKIMEDLPNDWIISKDEKNSVVDFIVNRFERIDEVLELLNLKGGDSSEIKC